jgi:hypothetical protein
MYQRVLLKAQRGKIGFFDITDFRGGTPEILVWGSRIFKRSTQDPLLYNESEFTYVIPSHETPEDE